MTDMLTGKQTAETERSTDKQTEKQTEGKMNRQEGWRPSYLNTSSILPSDISRSGRPSPFFVQGPFTFQFCIKVGNHWH